MMTKTKIPFVYMENLLTWGSMYIVLYCTVILVMYAYCIHALKNTVNLCMGEGGQKML